MLRTVTMGLVVAAAVLSSPAATHAGPYHQVRFHSVWGWSYPYCKPMIKWVKWYDAWGDRHTARLKVFDRRCPLPPAYPPRRASYGEVGSYYGYW